MTPRCPNCGETQDLSPDVTGIIPEGSGMKCNKCGTIFDSAVLISDMSHPEGITRLEIINHKDNGEFPDGRIFIFNKEIHYSNIDLSYQDDGKTLKIFLS